MADTNHHGRVHDPTAEYGLVTRQDMPALPAVNNGTFTGRNELGRFTAGNPGRPPGALGKRRQTAQELFEARNFDPLEKKLILCETLEKRLFSHHHLSAEHRIEYFKLYSEALKDVLQYSYQKLKSVESHTQVELIHKLQALEGMSDDELRQVIAEGQEYARQLPPGR
jgi:hypothetical protein